MSLMPGESVTLSCGFTGLPLPNITWSHDSGQVGGMVTTGNRSELTVQEVTRERGGVYRCTATNSEGNSLLEFTVQSKPHPLGGALVLALSPVHSIPRPSDSTHRLYLRDHCLPTVDLSGQQPQRQSRGGDLEGRGQSRQHHSGGH